MFEERQRESPTFHNYVVWMSQFWFRYILNRHFKGLLPNYCTHIVKVGGERVQAPLYLSTFFHITHDCNARFERMQSLPYIVTQLHL